MKWNWQQPDWPHFTYDLSCLEHLEALFLRESGFLAGTLHVLNDQDRERLTIELVCTEALQSSAIEGEFLDRDSLKSVQSVV